MLSDTMLEKDDKILATEAGEKAEVVWMASLSYRDNATAFVLLGRDVPITFNLLLTCDTDARHKKTTCGLTDL